MRFLTIGVYGTSEQTFFDALVAERVDTFCDIRWRRGVRGSDYAFVNSARLQKRLSELGIRYLHFRELAPPPELRERQAQADKAGHIAKRQRTTLGEAFIQGYTEGQLSAFDSQSFVQALGPEARVVALFCVEREPAACHRSLLAGRLEKELGISISHIIPPPKTDS